MLTPDLEHRVRRCADAEGITLTVLIGAGINRRDPVYTMQPHGPK